MYVREVILDGSCFLGMCRSSAALIADNGDDDDDDEGDRYKAGVGYAAALFTTLVTAAYTVRVIRLFVIPNTFVKWQPDDDAIKTRLKAQVSEFKEEGTQAAFWKLRALRVKWKKMLRNMRRQSKRTSEKLYERYSPENVFPDAEGQWDDTSGKKYFLKGYGQLFEDMRPASGASRSTQTTFRLCYAIASVIKIVVMSFFVGFFGMDSMKMVRDVAQENMTQLWLVIVLSGVGCLYAVVAQPFADPFANRVEVHSTLSECAAFIVIVACTFHPEHAATFDRVLLFIMTQALFVQIAMQYKGMYEDFEDYREVGGDAVQFVKGFVSPSNASASRRDREEAPDREGEDDAEIVENGAIVLADKTNAGDDSTDIYSHRL